MEKLDNHSILLKIYQEQQEIKGQLKAIPEMQEQLKAIPEMKEQLKAMPKMQEQLKAIPEMQEQLKSIPEMKEELRRISRSVARIEVEHGEKLQILFDAFKTHSEKLEEHEKRINMCGKHIENQDDQIYYLKSKVQRL